MDPIAKELSDTSAAVHENEFTCDKQLDSKDGEHQIPVNTSEGLSKQAAVSAEEKTKPWIFSEILEKILERQKKILEILETKKKILERQKKILEIRPILFGPLLVAPRRYVHCVGEKFSPVCWSQRIAKKDTIKQFWLGATMEELRRPGIELWKGKKNQEKAVEKLGKAVGNLRKLKEELGKANEELQKAKEELWKANEELQKANEELQKADEELQKAKENHWKAVTKLKAKEKQGKAAEKLMKAKKKLEKAEEKQKKAEEEIKMAEEETKMAEEIHVKTVEKLRKDTEEETPLVSKDEGKKALESNDIAMEAYKHSKDDQNKASELEDGEMELSCEEHVEAFNCLLLLVEDEELSSVQDLVVMVKQCHGHDICCGQDWLMQSTNASLTASDRSRETSSPLSSEEIEEICSEIPAPQTRNDYRIII